MVAPATSVFVLLTSLFLVSCSDSSQPVAPLPPATPVVTIVANPSGEGQEGIAGYPLPLPIRVEIRSDGVPLQGVVVNWTAPGGSVTPAVGVTDANGIASAEWTLGTASGPVTATARISQPAAKSATFTATAIEEVTAAAVAATLFQSAEVGTTLPQPLQMRVTKNGTPRAGVSVRWTVDAGSIAESSVTGADGIASAIWTMPTNPPGATVARATVRGDRAGVWTFQATARIGPPAQISLVSGAGQELPPYEDYFQPLSILVRDRFGNAIPWTPVAWVVEQGPVQLDERDEVTGPTGRSTATVLAGAPSGMMNAVVSAHVGNDIVGRFQLTIAPPRDTIFLNTNRRSFVSGRNRSSPAVDTVAAGTTVIWRLTVFDLDPYGVSPVGTPALPGGGDFPYASPSLVQIRFTEPGSYRYIDPYTSATGTVVVR